MAVITLVVLYLVRFAQYTFQKCVCKRVSWAQFVFIAKFIIGKGGKFLVFPSVKIH